MKEMHKGGLVLLFVMLQSAIVTILLDIGGSNIGVVTFLFYANLAGALTMLLIMYSQDKCREFLSIFKKRENLLLLVAMAFIIAVVAELLLVVGTIQTTPSISGILYRLYPIFIALFAPIVMRQKVSVRQYASLVLGFAGVYVILSNGSLLTLNISEVPAILMLVGSAIATAIPTLMVRKLNVSSSVFMALSTIIAVIVFLPAIFTLHENLFPTLSISTLASIIFIGVIEFGIGGVFYYYSYKRFNTSLTGAAMMSTPFLTVIMSYLILGTPMQPYYFLAAGLLATGVIMQNGEFLSAPERRKVGIKLKNTQIFDVTSAFISNKSPVIKDFVSGNNRALAIKLEGGEIRKFWEQETKPMEKAIFFMHTKPYPDIEGEEIDFLIEVLDLQEGRVALVGMGDPETVERALQDFKRMQEQAGKTA
ncbi:MAG: EamA family transporter [Candidatus Micrarchaeota archaeon]|nr:EamA family transporter [Candidatus Micrarchaeota archaeon]MDE1847902.1 EamA family transporter [Candidatus Micrarchaeota archaeon]MDE1864528.1 EamA family transporter [Candidatus Micrarchaeota archaeon]